jgi:hypothetical protein
VKNTDTEIAFEQKIVDIAHLYGWRVASFRNAGGREDGGHRTPVKYDGKGYTDLTLVHTKGQIVFAEIKRETGGRFSDDQREWAEWLTTCAETINSDLHDRSPTRVRYCAWRPRDGDSIITILSFGRVKTWTP